MACAITVAEQGLINYVSAKRVVLAARLRRAERHRTATPKVLSAAHYERLIREAKASDAWAPRPSCPTSCATRTRYATRARPNRRAVAAPPGWLFRSAGHQA